MQKLITAIIICVLCNCFSAQAQDGVYLEYSATDMKRGKPNGILKVSSSDGKTRSVREYIYGDKLYSSETLYLNSRLYFLDTKVYTKHPFELEEYHILIEERDTANGYDCTRITLTTRPAQIETITLWITGALPIMPAYMTSVIDGISISKLKAALKKQNESGVIVRFTYLTKWHNIQYDLRTNETRKFDPSIFDVSESEYKKARTGSAEKLREDGDSEETYQMRKAEESRIMEMRH